jgi:hypothetical protein
MLWTLKNIKKKLSDLKITINVIKYSLMFKFPCVFTVCLLESGSNWLTCFLNFF